MLFTSFTFFVFLGVLALLNALLPRRWRYLLLLAGSAFFYGSFGWKLGYLPFAVAALAWAGGRWMEKWNAEQKAAADKAPWKARRKRLIWALAGALAAVLAALKCAGLAPIGLSFYTLSAIGYLVDVYHGKCAAEKNPLRVAGFVICFLSLVQGPFTRYPDFGRQLNAGGEPDYEGLRRGAVRMLWGLVKKMVIADRLAQYVAAVFQAPGQYNGAVTLAAIFLYSLQIYADFSGYMDIVVGAARILGLKLPENFDNPLLADSTADFWRRWHITLGAWFKDYVFFPVSVSKRAAAAGKALRAKGRIRLAKLTPALLALGCVWPLTGLWHGATGNFLLWGLLNGLMIVLAMLTEPLSARALARFKIDPASRAWHVFRVARTFVLLSLIRVFARADSLSGALAVFRAMGNFAAFRPLSPASWFPGFNGADMGNWLVALLTMAGVLWAESRGTPEALLDKLCQAPFLWRCAFALALLVLVAMFGVADAGVFAGFLYAQF